MLTRLAIDWRGPQPRLVSYLGRRDDDRGAVATISTPDSGAVDVSHNAVFWLGVAAARGVGVHRLVLQVGKA